MAMIESETRITLLKAKASILLTHIFNADPKQVKKILAQRFISDKVVQDIKLKQCSDSEAKTSRDFSSSNTCVVLTKSFCQETYYNRLTREILIKRTWDDITPLEAAVWCGDIFILRELLTHIPRSQYKIAITQIQGILERNESSENGAFLAPYKTLLEACNIFFQQFFSLTDPHTCNWDALEQLWLKVWSGMRMLPRFGLQVYCSKTKDKPNYTQEPERSLYIYNDPELPLDLECMDFGHKNLSVYLLGQYSMRKFLSNSIYSTFIYLSEYLINELNNIIRELKHNCISRDFDSTEQEDWIEQLGICADDDMETGEAEVERKAVVEKVLRKEENIKAAKDDDQSGTIPADRDKKAEKIDPVLLRRMADIRDTFEQLVDGKEAKEKAEDAVRDIAAEVERESVKPKIVVNYGKPRNVEDPFELQARRIVEGEVEAHIQYLLIMHPPREGEAYVACTPKEFEERVTLTKERLLREKARKDAETELPMMANCDAKIQQELLLLDKSRKDAEAKAKAEIDRAAREAEEAKKKAGEAEKAAQATRYGIRVD